jgi:hypothetical protein
MSRLLVLPLLSYIHQKAAQAARLQMNWYQRSKKK